MKKTLLTIIVILIAVILMVVSASAETVQLTFVPPQTNEDGTPLDDLAGYNLYYQQTAGIDKATAQKKTLASDATGDTVTVPAGNWCFAMTAFDEVPNESKLSNEVCVDVADTTAPAKFVITIVGN